MSSRKTAIIILNYNNWEDTINCVKSILNQNTAEIKIIVVDNASNTENAINNLNLFFLQTFRESYVKCDYEKRNKHKELPDLSFIVSTKNDGYARGNNKGLEYAYADPTIENVMILNNDVLFVEDIIPSLLETLNRNSNVGIVCPLLYKKNYEGIDYNCARNNPSNWDIILTYLFLYRNFYGFLNRKDKRMFILKAHPEYKEKDRIEIELPSGSCMLMKKSVMQEINGFDPNTFLYYEEPILFKKLSEKGFHNYLIPQCKCIHLGASSTSKTSNMFITRQMFNSMEYYFRQYSPLNTLQKITLFIAKQLYCVKIWAKTIIQS